MDILGRKAEEAKEDVEQVSGELQNLRSHLDALDNALQDFMQRSGRLMTDDLKMEEGQLKEIDRLDREELDDRHRIEELEEDLELLLDEVRDLSAGQRDNRNKIEEIADSELLDVVEKIRNMINVTNKRYFDLKDSIEELEQRINQLENDFVMEVNNREFDFEKKVDQKEFDSTEEELRNEIKKLRSSLNILAEDVDDTRLSPMEMN